MSKREQIIQKAIEVLAAEAGGLRYAQLHKRIMELLPGIGENNIHGTIWNLEVRVPADVYKPAKGLFRHAKYQKEQPALAEEQQPHVAPKIHEEDFYEAFAQYLVNDLQECTKAIAVGGNKLKDKWGTPDVIGVLKAKDVDVFKFPTEVVSAEIKIDTLSLITAFGQACAYRLFSHKSYIVVPGTASGEDKDRLEALCLSFGIGLVLFNPSSLADPGWTIRVRATRHEPDMFYLNQNVKPVAEALLS
jgi:hypothetical protein